MHNTQSDRIFSISSKQNICPPPIRYDIFLPTWVLVPVWVLPLVSSGLVVLGRGLPVEHLLRLALHPVTAHQSWTQHMQIFPQVNPHLKSQSFHVLTDIKSHGVF